jgi:superfamily II DNA helicase RecQ
MSVEDVKRHVAGLRGRAHASGLEIGHGELGDRERVLLSIAERAGAVELQPGGQGGLLVTLTGRGSPRKAYEAIRAAQNRGWESYRSIERFSAGAELCRRRQILDHFGDEQPGRPTGRCCDVCDPDATLEQALHAAPATSRPRGRRPPRASAEQRPEPIDEVAFERLRAWRMQRAAGNPAYTVAANSVLEEVLRRRPESVRELLAISGIGPAFCEKHGESLLGLLAELGPARPL